MLSIDDIARRVQTVRSAAASRDSKMWDVRAVRDGDIESVYPDLWPATWPKSITSNFIDVVARDVAEVLAPLPAFNCSSASGVKDKARKFADLRTRIAHYYISHSELQRQMFDAADQYLTYGFVPFIVEPDFDAKCSVIRTESPLNAYPEWDRFGRLISYTKVFRKKAHELVALYPDLAEKILGDKFKYDKPAAYNAQLELIRYEDKDQTVLYLHERGDLVLEHVPNPLGKMLTVVARRPNGTTDDTSGQFDDVVWVQLARAYMAMLGLEAAEKSVRAPIALPTDVQEFVFGADAVLRSQNPQAIRRVGMELPPGAFEEQQMLDDEQRMGSRYPDARSGNIQSSVITGQGVEALMGTFDSQIKANQEIFRDVFRKVIGLCFALDEAMWPNLSKTIRGEHNGAPYEVTYIPSKDISGDYTINVTYGFMSGLQPNQALVFMLQLRGDKLISRDTVQRQMPFDVDVSDEQMKVDVEEIRDALKQAIFGIGQAAPEIVAQGGSPTQLIGQMASMIQDVQKGTSIEEAAAKAFQPPPAPPEAAAPDDGSAGGDTGLTPEGQAPGVAPGQQGEGPGGRPALQALLAGLTSSGQPSLQANVTQRVPVQP